MNIVAIVLAGGKSSRMGRDKALLEVDGETLLLRTCRIALQVAHSSYVVARSQEQYQKAIATDLPQLSVVLDRQFDGALVGFWQGTEAIAVPVDWYLLLACDLPRLQGDILQNWANQLEHLPPNAIAYLPRYADENGCKQWEPLCGFYRRKSQDSLRQFIAAGGRSFQKWLSDREVIEIASPPVSMLFNCNSPKDFYSL